MSQCTDTILMIRPQGFRSNEETRGSNHFQPGDHEDTGDDIAEMATNEFDSMVNKLSGAGIKVLQADYPATVDTPDRIFPNNWFSLHDDGRVVLYPMHARNRRLERRPEILQLLKVSGFAAQHVLDLTGYEQQDIFLEGTGSLVLDRVNRYAYAAISARTHTKATLDFCERLGYESILFHAWHTVNKKRVPVYHTNVIMSIGEKIAIICEDSIDDLSERKRVINKLSETHELVIISEQQVDQFAGNMLEISNQDQEHFMVMSSAAYASLLPGQIKKIEAHCKIIHSSLDTIEKYGGGSARCMMAEVFLPFTK